MGSSIELLETGFVSAGSAVELDWASKGLQNKPRIASEAIESMIGFMRHLRNGVW
jgi:hypothetical protein